MRNCDLNTIDGAINLLSEEVILETYRRAYLCKCFELYLQGLMKTHDFKMPIYLSSGHEFSAAAVSMAYPDCAVFAQHRGHSWYLSYGGNIIELIDELLGKDSGCCSGMGGSPCIQDKRIKYFGHSGLLGDQVPIAIGYAIGNESKVLAVVGDAAAEEDYVLASMGFAQTKALPVLFVCEDNNLSILTTKEVRRSWDVVNVSNGFGMPSCNLADDPWTIITRISGIKSYPYYLNILVCRRLWHVGCGQDNEPEWDRFVIVEKQLDSIGLSKEVNSIKRTTELYVKDIWEEQLRKQ